MKNYVIVLSLGLTACSPTPDTSGTITLRTAGFAQDAGIVCTVKTDDWVLTNPANTRTDVPLASLSGSTIWCADSGGQRIPLGFKKEERAGPIPFYAEIFPDPSGKTELVTPPAP